MASKLLINPKPVARGLSAHDIYVADGVDPRPTFERAQDYATKLGRTVRVSAITHFARQANGITPAPRRMVREFYPEIKEAA